MKLDDLIAELEKPKTECTALVRVSQGPIQLTSMNGRERRMNDLVVVNGEVEVIRREPQEMLPSSVVLVEQNGYVQYMRRDPDGRLGAIEEV